MSHLDFEKIYLIIQDKENSWFFTKNIWKIYHEDREIIHEGNLKIPDSFKLYGDHYINTKFIKKSIKNPTGIIIHLFAFNKVFRFEK